MSRKPERAQASRVERTAAGEPDLNRRRLLKLITAATTVAAGGVLGNKMAEELDTLTTSKKSASESTPEPAPQVEQGIPPSEILSNYSFLTPESHPEKVETGALAGQKFADLYAAYLGTLDGSTVPKTLDVDFKTNLAALWCEKFGFDSPNASPELFAQEYPELMDLAEQLYSSYNRADPQRKSLEKYLTEIKTELDSAQKAYEGALHALEGVDGFSPAHRVVMMHLADRISEDSLLALSLTELMPSRDGKLNTQLFDFLTSNAGEAFIYRIPAVHDLQKSYGPYQFTPAILAPGGVGSVGEAIKNKLPKGYFPDTLEAVTEQTQHRVAYLIAVMHVAQLVGELPEKDARLMENHIEHTGPKALEEEVSSFIAMAHHNPVAAYAHFKRLWLSPRAEHEFTPVRDSLHEVGNVGVREYVHKALDNYTYLTQARASNELA